ncbi:hypothetical protein HK104_002160 [Borealophlyctis nickersoniae]|nr:hypothetical protein HK104_002160 [Borealophlyctis nickersoniae]
MGLINAVKPGTTTYAAGGSNSAAYNAPYAGAGGPCTCGSSASSYSAPYAAQVTYNSAYTNQANNFAAIGRAGAGTGTVTSEYGKGNRYTTQNPAVVKERVIQHQHEEITPVVEREREETQVRHIVQPIHDHRKETHHHQASHPPVARETIEDLNPEHVRRYLALRNAHQPGRIIDEPTRSQTVNEPIIHEIIKPHIIEEIQPVIHREIKQTHIIHRHQPVYERHVAAPKVIESTTLEAISLEEFQVRGFGVVDGAASGFLVVLWSKENID